MDIESAFRWLKDFVLFNLLSKVYVLFNFLPKGFVLFILAAYIILRARAEIFNRLRHSAGIGRIEKNTSEAKTEKSSEINETLQPEIITAAEQENQNKEISSKIDTEQLISGSIEAFLEIIIINAFPILIFPFYFFLANRSSDEFFVLIFVFGLLFLVGLFALLKSSMKDRYMSFLLFLAIVLIVFLIIGTVGLYEFLVEIFMNYHGGGFAP